MLPFRMRLVKVDPPWLAGRLHTCILVPALRLYLPPHPLLYSAPSGRGTLDMSQPLKEEAYLGQQIIELCILSFRGMGYGTN